MSLMRRGALFAGALFAGVLFGPAWAAAATYLPPAGRPRRRPEPFIPAPIPWQQLDRRRDDEDALLLAALL